MIKTGTKELGDCINCLGTGVYDVTRCCPAEGCNHKHEEPTVCESCNGTGQCEYEQYAYDPNCEYCVNNRVHPVHFFLPEIKAKRGPIEFHPVTDEAP